MKKVTMLICIIIYGQQASAQQEQSAFYDARFLYDSCFGKEDGRFIHRVSLFDVMKKYYHVASLSEAELKKNPFFGIYVPELVSQAAGEKSIFSNGLSFSSLGNLDVTTIVDGFAKFIVERTKKELQAAYFDRFIKELGKPEYKDARTLFPATWTIVQQLPNDVFNYEKYLQSLRDAFGKDMEAILVNVEEVLKNGNFKQFFNQHPELKSVCLTALHFGKGLIKGKHMGTLLEEYDPANPDFKFGSADADFIRINAVKFLKEISFSFRSIHGKDNEYWVPADSILLMVNNPVTFNIYLGLLYQRVNGLKVYNAGTLTYGSVMKDIVEPVEKMKSLVENIADQVSNLQTKLSDLQDKPKIERGIDDYIGYFNSATRMIESFKENELVRNITSLLPDTIKERYNFFWKKYSSIIDGTNAVLSIYTGIKEKNYSVAISNVRALYQMRYEPGKANHDSTGSKVKKVIAFLLDKGAFIAGVAQAKTSDEVHAAINMVAMPAGSARVKRLSGFNVAINAYCGLFIGSERIREVDKDFKVNNYGLTAPIGITISMGTKKGWSHSLLISAVDIGAVTAFRFTNDTTAQVPTIQLKNILSPGLFYSLGIRRSPLSVNIGAQVGPNLRKVTSMTNDYSNNTYIRYSLSFCVDLPLFNLYTRTR